ncbi:MAG: hypothetical protein CMF25_04635 [Kangiellaceae bacterium]|nr:hypothetical protein [Kangiellaceae bacterium]
MKKTIKRSFLATSILLACQNGYALEFDIGKLEGNFDSTFSYGFGVRLENQDKDLIGKSNNLGLEPGTTQTASPLDEGAWSTNADDGNQNFDKGDLFTHAIKGTHDLELRYKNYGAFMRGTYFYDFVLKDSDLNHVDLTEAAEDQHGFDAEVLDMFIYAKWFDVKYPFQLRLGEQAISWGESTFIQHGISEINPVDLPKLRVPGAELKEAFRPFGALWGSVSVTNNIGFEGFYQYDWEASRIDAPGTYFATSDFAGAGGRNVQLNFGLPAENGINDQGLPLYAQRISDRKADKGGQYGLRMSWFAEKLNETEFNFYYVNYHNRRPVISAYGHNGYIAEGFLEYIEDIEMYGLSFNTVLPKSGVSIAGEISYRDDEPLQIDDVELLFAALQPSGSIPEGTSQIEGTALPGGEISGYRLFDTVQGQTTISQVFGPRLGADNLVMAAEVGFTRINAMPDQNELRLEAPATFRSGNPARAGFEGVETNSFADAFSWGYRAVARMEFNDAFWGVNVYPKIAWQHDVNGTTPAPINNFIEGRRAFGAGVKFDYLNKWSVDVDYNNYFGAGTANLLRDRDYIGITLKYSI